MPCGCRRVSVELLRNWEASVRQQPKSARACNTKASAVGVAISEANRSFPPIV